MTEKSFTEKELTLLLRQSPAHILQCLTKRTGKSKACIQNNSVTQREQVLFLQCVKEALKSTANAQNSLTLVSLLTSTRYTAKLHDLFLKIKKSSDRRTKLCVIKDIVCLLSNCFSRMPTSFLESLGFLQVIEDDIKSDLKTEPNCESEKLIEDLGDLKQSILNHVSQRVKIRGTSRQPPDDFRKISILPCSEDILSNCKPFLRKIPRHGPFDNLDHYLDVHFRLLREDCISQLRDGIAEYIIEKQQVKKAPKRLQDAYLYKNVKVIGKEKTIEGTLYSIKLDPKHAKNIQWDRSKRLLYGTLVCLSPNDFKNIYFAVVNDRDKIKRSCVIKIQMSDSNCVVDTSNKENIFTMVESTAFFESYRHVLECLQNINKGDFPFEQYLVHCSETMMQPMYLRKTDSAVYDLYPVISNTDIRLVGDRHSDWKRRKTINQKRNVDILYDNWPEAKELQLNQSQYGAFKAALTEELVIIQGPPGTGKTYLGLKIAKTLLHNRQHWMPSLDDETVDSKDETDTQPMLVVCYTNHALDQFLEGIIHFIDSDGGRFKRSGKLIRVGGRCSNEIVEEYSLRRARRNVRLHVDQFQYTQLLRKNQHDTAKLKWKISKSKLVVLDSTQLSSVMPRHYMPLSVLRDASGNCMIGKWLGLDDKSLINSAHEAFNSNLMRTLTEEIYDTTEKADNDEMGTRETIFIDVETDEQQAMNNRRIEEDELETDYEFKDYLGIDIDERLDKLLNDSKYNNKMTKRFLQDEAKKLKGKLTATVTMTEEEAEIAGFSIWDLNKNERWRLHNFWSQKYRENLQKEIKEKEIEFSGLYGEYKREKQKVDKLVLQRSTIIGMTTTGASRYHDILREIGPKIVIVEEAAEVLEAHIIASLSPKCEHLILIGDHKQLEPKPAVYELAIKYNLSLSLFERLINNDVKFHCLQRQHRMRPEISQLVRHIYPRLEDNENVLTYCNIKGVGTNVFFLTHNVLEDYKDDGKTYSNRHEALFVMRLCKYLLQQEYNPEQITILTPYSGQLFCIRNVMPKNEFEGVRISILDNYQGEENDVILLSLVRSNKQNKIGFLDKENRVCVALSRAKRGLFVIGNFELLRNHSKGGKLWASVMKGLGSDYLGNVLPLYCQNHPHDKKLVKSDEDFNKFPDGGCSLKCDFRLACGHVCRLFCHPYDRKHEQYKCRVQCLKRCKMDHPCLDPCHHPNECICKVEVEKKLPFCEHTAKMACHMQPEDFECPIIVTKHLKCRHTVNLPCHIDIEEYQCIKLVVKQIPRCGHEAEMKCHLEPTRYKCQLIVEKLLPCGHKVVVPCHMSTASYQCKEMVTKTLPSCGHQASMPCYMELEKYKCMESVSEKWPSCSHSYIRECYVSSLKFQSENKCKEVVTKIISKCRHPVQLMCSENVENTKCSRIIEWKFQCLHPSIHIKCYKSSDKHRCSAICGQKCDRGHTCKKLCHYPKDCECQTVVNKIIPNCGHSVDMLCNADPSNVMCSKQVSKTLLCGHKMMLECSVSINSILCSKLLQEEISRPIEGNAVDNLKRCDEPTNMKLPCGHRIITKCCVSPKDIKCAEEVMIRLGCGHMKAVLCYKKSSENDEKCREMTSTTLPCGHQTMKECHRPPKDINCTTIVTRLCPQCKREVKMECHKNSNIYKCKEMIKKVIPGCNHQQAMECYKDPQNVMCVTNVSIVHPNCNHTVKVRCSKVDKVVFPQNIGSKQEEKYTPKHVFYPKCTKLVDVLLLCGERVQIECCKSHNTAKMTCSTKATCHKRLQCGHPCPRRCVDCKSIIHARCHKECRKTLFCGHPCISKTCGRCGVCNQPCNYKCSHEECNHPCSEMCSPCTEKCSWSCPHVKCNLLCHQICDRARCNERCIKPIPCGHSCTGFCGDPCPSICRECHWDKLKSITKKNPKNVILVELQDCHHVFDSKEIDHYMDKVSTSYINIKRCPKCQTIITLHPRYTNVLKRQRQNVNLIRETLASMVNKNSLCPIVLDLNQNYLQQCLNYMETFQAFLCFNDSLRDKYQDMYQNAKDRLDIIIDRMETIRNSTVQTYLDVYNLTMKACALWMLFIVLGNFKEKSATQTEDKDKDSSNSLPQNVLLNIMNMVNKPEVTQQTLEEIEHILVCSGQAGNVHKQLMCAAKSYPSLPFSVDIHQKCWRVCREGHLYCSIYDDVDKCWNCDKSCPPQRQDFIEYDKVDKWQHSLLASGIVCNGNTNITNFEQRFHENNRRKSSRRGRISKGQKHDGNEHKVIYTKSQMSTFPGKGTESKQRPSQEGFRNTSDKSGTNIRGIKTGFKQCPVQDISFSTSDKAEQKNRGNKTESKHRPIKEGFRNTSDKPGTKSREVKTEFKKRPVQENSFSTSDKAEIKTLETKTESKHRPLQEGFRNTSDKPGTKSRGVKTEFQMRPVHVNSFSTSDKAEIKTRETKTESKHRPLQEGFRNTSDKPGTKSREIKTEFKQRPVLKSSFSPSDKMEKKTRESKAESNQRSVSKTNKTKMESKQEKSYNHTDTPLTSQTRGYRQDVNEIERYRRQGAIPKRNNVRRNDIGDCSNEEKEEKDEKSSWRRKRGNPYWKRHSKDN